MKTIEKQLLPNKEECAVSFKNILDAMYVLSGKWKIALILNLMQSSKRFNEIKRELEGISPKVLAKELKDLELNGFVNRIENVDIPVTIVYEATSYSHTLRAVIRELSIWGEMHREKVKASMRK